MLVLSFSLMPHTSAGDACLVSRVRRAAHLVGFWTRLREHGGVWVLLFPPDLGKYHVIDYIFWMLTQHHRWPQRVPAVYHAASAMPLRRVSEAPVYRAAEAAEGHQGSTPESFRDIPPSLIQELPCVSLRMQPAPSDVYKAEAATPAVLHANGRLWLTEKEITFLPGDTQAMYGFTLTYPSVALHAVSRSVPDDMKLDGLYRDACLYCQLDDHPEQDVEEDENDEAVKEMWLAIPDAETRT